MQFDGILQKNQSSFEWYKHKQTPHFVDVLNNLGKQEHWI